MMATGERRTPALGRAEFWAWCSGERLDAYGLVGIDGGCEPYFAAATFHLTPPTLAIPPCPLSSRADNLKQRARRSSSHIARNPLRMLPYHHGTLLAGAGTTTQYAGFSLLSRCLLKQPSLSLD